MHDYSASTEGASKSLRERYSGAWPLLPKKVIFIFLMALL